MQPAPPPAPKILPAPANPPIAPGPLGPAPKPDVRPAPPALPPAPIVPPATVKPPIAPGPLGPAPLPVSAVETPYYVPRQIVRQYGEGGFPFMPEPPPFSSGPYPACRDNWLAVADPMAKVQASNECKRAFTAYKINWLNEYRKAMNSYAGALGEIYTKEVAPDFFNREGERQDFYREMTRRVEGVRDGGYLMADYERVVAQYDADFKAVIDSYNRAAGCYGYPTPAGLAPNPNC